ncbi:MAG: ribonuclease Y [Planctomycetes bacterium]|nr:ribonuclease Y [Planctomycetota bacterium]
MDPLLATAVGATAGAVVAWVVSRSWPRPPSAADEARRREVEARAAAAERAVEEARAATEAAAAARRDAEVLAADAKARLAAAAGLSPAEARARALEELDRELAQERARRVEAVARQAREEADARARAVVCTALQRVAVAHATERTVTSVPLPDEAMKGRVIGREGRNAKAFEAATGCDLLVDETPGVVTISAFDPVRREVARRALAALVADGRIQPAQIEEAVATARRAVEGEVTEAGRRALLDADVGDAHPRVVELLGRLQWRTSYGQNVLRHAVEVAHLCGAMAGELGLDARTARRAGLLHDLGKAVEHDVEGGHAAVGADVARRCGEAPLVVNAIASHHEDVPQESAYAVLAQVGDAISAARPGARSDTVEKYVRRLADLERVAASFAGVEDAYAIQAGRELRVLVDGKAVSDAAALALAREIAAAVERELAYPGEVRVTVLRETRAVSYAR